MTKRAARTRKPKPPTRRQNHGKGHAYYDADRKVPGVTTIIGDGIPKDALIDWAARTTAGYAVDHWDELAEKPVSQRLEELKQARWKVSGPAAVRGTDVHKLAHRLGQGEEVEVEDHLRDHVDSCVRFLDTYDVEVILAEVIAINRTPWGTYMGSFDLLARLHALNPDEVWLLDYKTGGVYDEAAVQLAAYDACPTYLDVSVDPPVERELPQADRLGVVQLRADGFDIYPADVWGADDLDPFRVFGYAAQIKRYKDAPRGTYIGPALDPPRSPS